LELLHVSRRVRKNRSLVHLIRSKRVARCNFLFVRNRTRITDACSRRIAGRGFS
jgi:hypothetical protein